MSRAVLQITPDFPINETPSSKSKEGELLTHDGSKRTIVQDTPLCEDSAKLKPAEKRSLWQTVSQKVSDVYQSIATTIRECPPDIFFSGVYFATLLCASGMILYQFKRLREHEQQRALEIIQPGLSPSSAKELLNVLCQKTSHRIEPFNFTVLQTLIDQYKKEFFLFGEAGVETLEHLSPEELEKIVGVQEQQIALLQKFNEDVRALFEPWLAKHILKRLKDAWHSLYIFESMGKKNFTQAKFRQEAFSELKRATLSINLEAKHLYIKITNLCYKAGIPAPTFWTDLKKPPIAWEDLATLIPNKK